MKTFGRAVSLTDVADLVRATGEVAKAQSVELWDGLDRAIHVTVAGQAAGVFADADLRRIGAALAGARDPGTRVLLDNFRPLAIVLGATVTVDDATCAPTCSPPSRPRVRDALSFDRALLGTPVHLSDIYRVIQDVDGVARLGHRRAAGQAPRRPQPPRRRPAARRHARARPGAPAGRARAARPGATGAHHRGGARGAGKARARPHMSATGGLDA